MNPFENINKADMVEILKTGVDAWNRWRGDIAATEGYIDLTQLDLSEQDLAGVNLSRADLTNTDFTNANLENSNFSFSRVWAAQFNGARLARSVFLNAKVGGSDFTQADLDEAKLISAELVVHFDVFWEALLMCGRVIDVTGKACFKQASMRQTDLSYSRLLWAQVQDAATSIDEIQGLDSAYISGRPVEPTIVREVLPEVVKRPHKPSNPRVLVDFPTEAHEHPELLGVMGATHQNEPTPENTLVLPDIDPLLLDEEFIERLQLLGGGVRTVSMGILALAVYTEQAFQSGLDETTKQNIRASVEMIRSKALDRLVPILVLLIRQIDFQTSGEVPEITNFLRSLA